MRAGAREGLGAEPETFEFTGKILTSRLTPSGDVDVTFRVEWFQHDVVFGMARWLDTKLKIQVRAGER